jgi:hypothetical protein
MNTETKTYFYLWFIFIIFIYGASPSEFFVIHCLHGHKTLSMNKYTRESERTKPSTRESKRASSYQSDPLPGTAWKAEVGSDLPSGRASEASSVPTYTNLPVS